MPHSKGEFLQWLMERNITPYMRTRDSLRRKNSPLYGPERFTYQPASNSYMCPAGEQLNYGGHSARNRTHVYIGTRKRCVFLLALIFVLAFLEAYRIRKKWMRIPVYISCSVGAVLSGLLLAFMLFAAGEANETVTEARNGPFKALVRSQEFHHSGSIIVDVCVTDSSSLVFPKRESPQCFLHGYDFSGLSVKWLSQQNIEIAFDCGRVTTFTNSALLYPNGPSRLSSMPSCMMDVPIKFCSWRKFRQQPPLKVIIGLQKDELPVGVLRIN